MRYPIEPLEKAVWKGTLLPIAYTSTECYHVAVERTAEGFCVPIRRIALERPFTHVPEDGEYPDRLKQACGMLASNICQAKSFNGAKQLTSLDFQVLMTDDSFFTSDIKMLLKGLDSDVQLF